MKGYNYTIYFDWRVEPTTPAILGERFLRTLDLIVDAAPEIGAWTVVDLRNGPALIPIDEARKNITEIVETNVATCDDEPDPDYGYRLVGVNTPEITPRSLSWSAGVGGKFGDKIDFHAGYILVPPDPEIVTYHLFRTVLLTTLALWPSTWANAYASKPDYDKVSPAPGIPPHPQSRYLIPWLSYLSAPLAEGLDVPPEIRTERPPDGGLLMIAAEDRLDPTDPEQMRRSRKIAEIMVQRAGDPGSETPPLPKTRFSAEQI